MKKNIIALAVASAIAAPVAMADAPVVYGQVNMSIDSNEIKTATGSATAGDGVAVNSVASRVGVKGSEDLGNGLKAVYKLEFGVQIDGSATLKNRNQFVGLAGGFGTVLMGRHDTPTKMSQVKDFFNDGPGDLGKSSLTSDSSLKGGEIRTSNVLAYVSPSFSGVKVVLAAVPSEGDKINDAGVTKDSGIADTYSAALMYGSKKKGLYLAAGMDSYGQQSYTAHDDSTAVNAEATYTRLSAQYAAGGLTVNGMYAMTDIDTNTVTQNVDSNTMVIGAAYKMGKFTPKAKYSVSSWDKKSDAAAVFGVNMTDKTMVALGVDYALGKKTTGYVNYVAIDGADYGTKKTEDNTVSVGLLHKF